jgi:cytochrome-b5 reductase
MPMKGHLPEFPTSSFVYIYSDDLVFRRPYTPLRVSRKGVDFVVKIYEKGTLSRFILSKDVNDSLNISGPINKRMYIHNEFENVLMIAGGTGITPMVQVLETAATIPDNRTNFTLFFCNVSREDIFLEDYISKYKVKIIHVLEKQSSGKEKAVHGRISTSHIRDIVLKNGKKIVDFIYVCGPPSMIKDVCGPKGPDKGQGELKGMLRELGYTEDEVYKF